MRFKFNVTSWSGALGVQGCWLFDKSTLFLLSLLLPLPLGSPSLSLLQLITQTTAPILTPTHSPAQASFTHARTLTHTYTHTLSHSPSLSLIQINIYIAHNGRTILLVLIPTRLFCDSAGLVGSTRQETILKTPCRPYPYFYLYYCRRGVCRSQQTELCHPGMRPLSPTQSQVR
jgi:hypothetical protein